MKNKIKVDYDIMVQLVNVLGDEIGSIEAANSQLDKFVEGEIRANWKGVAANEFFSEWERIRENLQKLHKALELGQVNYLYILQIFHAAEEKAKSHIHKQSTDIFTNRK